MRVLWENPIINPVSNPAQMSATEKVRAYLQRVRLNSGGYDSRGRYWGLGKPLYTFDLVDERGRYLGREDGIYDFHIRADNRAHAKDLIRRRFPHLDIRFVR